MGLPTTWILKFHAMTDNPDQFLNNESINPADLVIDFKATTSGAGSPLSLGPSMTMSLQQLTVKGDINADERIDISDVQLLADFLSGAGTLTPDQQFRADVYPPASSGNICGNGALDLLDLSVFVDIVEDRVSVETPCIP